VTLPQKFIAQMPISSLAPTFHSPNFVQFDNLTEEIRLAITLSLDFETRQRVVIRVELKYLQRAGREPFFHSGELYTVETELQFSFLIIRNPRVPERQTPVKNLKYPGYTLIS
jgi:hypothetical protein